MAHPPSPPTLPLHPQVLVENRLSKRQRHVDLSDTPFYQQTAKTDPGRWEEGPILEAKQELCRQLREQGRTMIGGCHTCSGSALACTLPLRICYVSRAD